MTHTIIQLDNGIRIILQRQKTSITHTCLIINKGSRHEDKDKYGMAHFIEHMVFKKTNRRNTSQILNRLESLGGDLNAYTTKEYTCIHASILNPYLSRALDLLEDIVFHSTFPESEMEKEKSVILDEMASYLDSPEDSIMDDFEDLLFCGSGLGHNILGLQKDLISIQRQDILNYLSKNYTNEEVVIGISGDYTVNEVTKIANKIFNGATVAKNIIKPDLQNSKTPQHIHIQKAINQSHYVIGTKAYGIHDESKTTTLLLNNLVGSAGMSSILNLSIRERHGIAYTIESNYALYNDTGAFSIYLGADEEKLEKATSLVRKELNKLMNKPIGPKALIKAKKRFKGQIALAEENRLSVIIAETKNVLDHNRIISVDEVFRKIDLITEEDILAVANDLFDENKMVSLTFCPG